MHHIPVVFTRASGYDERMVAASPTAGSSSDRTRDSIVSAARTAFAAEGYAEVSLERIATDAGVTKGAIYHHFSNKQDLFIAALEDVEEEVQQRVRRASRGQRTPLDRLKVGFAAYLDAVLDPEIGRISVVDGPSVIGADQYKRLSKKYAHDDVVFTLGVGMPDADEAEIEALSSILLGAVMHAALILVSSESPVAAREDMGVALNRMLDGVLSHPGQTSDPDRK